VYCTVLCIVHVRKVYTAKTGGPEERSRYTDSLGLDGPGIESRWRDFPHPFRPALKPVQTPVQGVPGSFSRVYPPKRDVAHATSPSAEVKERVKLYVGFPLWAFVACSKVKFIFYLYL
jgi:hypothetical protein